MCFYLISFTSKTYYDVENESKYERLSRCLYETLPSREDVEIIFKARPPMAILCYEMLSISYTSLEQSGIQVPEILPKIPGPKVDPVLIARY